VSIANVILVLNPQKVVLGDRGLSAAGVLLAPIAARVAQIVPVMPPIEPSRLGPNAALVGATLWAARHASREIVAALTSPAGPDMPLRYAALGGAS
jgi:predicted NBD/HSP70 family sugar kinase